MNSNDIDNAGTLQIQFDEKTAKALTLVSDALGLNGPDQAVMLAVGQSLNSIGAQNDLLRSALTELGWVFPNA